MFTNFFDAIHVQAKQNLNQLEFLTNTFIDLHRLVFCSMQQL